MRPKVLLPAPAEGPKERAFGSYRYGGAAGEKGHYRLYGKYFERDASYSMTGDNYDDWRMGQAGFRTDWNVHENDSVTIQGDTYHGESGTTDQCCHLHFSIQ